MARTFTLGSVRTQVRQRADMQSTAAQQFITDSEINLYINQSYTELYDLLISSGGQEYYLSSIALTPNTTTGIATLPSDFYRLLGVDAILSANQAITLQPFLFNERNLYKSVYAGGWGIDYNMRYRVYGGLNIEFIPVPLSTITFTLWYIPCAVTLVADNDTADGVDGFEELLVIDAAIKCLQKEESDVSVLMARKAEMVARIGAMSPYRDASRAERVTDVSAALLSSWPWA